jgi:hypothetical protein
MKKLLLTILLTSTICFSQECYELKVSKRMLEWSIGRLLSKEGVKETGNNAGPDVEMFLKSVGRKPPDAWCMATQYWSGEDLGEPNPLVKSGLCYDMYRYARKYGVKVFLNPFTDDLRGALIIWNHPRTFSGHIGRILLNEKGNLLTIEGNTSGGRGSQDNGGMVAKKHRTLKNLGSMKVLCVIKFKVV